MEKIRVLFLAASPTVSPLSLDQEIREITTKMRAAEYRDSLEIISRWAVRPDDLQQALLEHQPHVLHFSGHGTESEELVLLDDKGKPKPVSKAALVELLRVLKDNLRLVVLNACFSRPQAEAITQVVDFAVGMNRAIGDEAAIKFAAAFYRAIGFGRSIQTAFDLGRSALHLDGIPEETTPTLVFGAGLDPAGIVLVGPELEGQEGGSRHAPNTELPAVVPQGLKSFGEDAKDFFLRLLPGPYRENGLPESLHFWKRQIEQTDADETIRVGVIYGKSGCGKSSWIKAGLLPRLEGVTSVYVEAIPDGTPQRLLAAIRKRCPWLGDVSSLSEALQRKDRIPATTKVLLVLDQFEQWLHGRTEDNYAELLDALQACDGTRVQCLLLIRSDFWDLLTRFLQRLSVRQEEGRNLAMCDLFDKRHARHVLTLFGEAYGALSKAGEHTPEQEDFLNQAIEGLAEDGRIVCVRLSLFAQMLKGMDWAPANLAQIGGPKGVGFAFMEKNFSSKDTPTHLRHEAAARAVLECLLPPQGTDIRGVMRSEDELREKSGYARKPAKFADLINILDGQLRLITPTAAVEYEHAGDPDDAPSPGSDTDTTSSLDAVVVSGANNDAVSGHPVTKYYQLTHDYLVPSLHDWLTAKQRKTWRGRAMMLLAERTAEYTPKPRIRELPGPLEYVRILAAVLLPTCRLQRPPQTPSPMERRLLWATARWYALTGGLLAVLLLVSGWWRWEMNGRDFARDLANQLNRTMDPSDHKKLVDEKLLRYRRWLQTELFQRLQAMPDEKSTNAVRVDFGKRRADEAISLVRLEAYEEALAAFQWRSHGDPEASTQFIHRAKERGVTIEQLVGLYQRAMAARDIDTRFTMLLTLGQYSDVLETSRRREVAERLKLNEVYSTDPSSAIHGASAWLLRAWQLDMPALEPTTAGVQERDWMMIRVPANNPQEPPLDLTLVRIPAGVTKRMEDKEFEDADKPLSLSYNFWMSDREISVQAYERFINDVRTENSNFRSEMMPGIDWPSEEWTKVQFSPQRREATDPFISGRSFEIMAFCNWLSWLHGLTPCYQRKLRDQAWPWILVSNAAGYRVPTEIEWEYACRSGTVTAFGFGSDSSLLSNYAAFAEPGNPRSNGTPIGTGTRMPNFLGLYDLHGSAYELCATPDVTKPEGEAWAIRGGAVIGGVYSCRSASRSPTLPGRPVVGFRVVRLAPPAK